MAPIFLQMKSSKEFEPCLISTGQHREMLDQMFRVFRIVPDVDLNVMIRNQTLPSLTSRVLESMSAVLNSSHLDALLVQGDTTTAFASAIAGFYARIPIGHVEAGLRTFDMNSPWPEEFNRRLIDPICQWCFAPTHQNRENLLREGIASDRVHVTGNTVIDALILTAARVLDEESGVHNSLNRFGLNSDFIAEFLSDQAQTNGRKVVLVTAHRRESFGNGIERICGAIVELCRRYPDLGVIYPVHLNPNVQEPVRRLLGGRAQIQLIEPVDYETFVWLMSRSFFVISDSGGVQEEAPSLGKPVLVTRETTERQEGVMAGTCRLVGSTPELILKEASLLIENATEYNLRTQIKNPYGDGVAAARILRILKDGLA